MRRQPGLIILAIVVIVGVAAFGLTQLAGSTKPAYSANVISALQDTDTTGYARATTVRDFKFPADHGAHPEFQTEWWYYTGNLATADGRRFGFELTIFRRAIAPTMPARQSDWATNQIYFAHFAVSDIGANQFYEREKYSRGAAGLAGATLDPRPRIWIEDWAITAQNDDASTFRLTAADEGIAIDLTVRQDKVPVLEGDHGLSAKSAEPGNASYYYSLTHLLTDGAITVNGTVYQVSGTTWMDREWSTSQLGKDAVGWDWFALQLDDKREIMLYQIRLKDGSIEPMSDGTFVNADGSIIHLSQKDYTIEVLDHWKSPNTGGLYPSRWKVTIRLPDGAISLDIAPLMADQELHASSVYWEGASKISGTAGDKPVQGYGYVELTGYNVATTQDAPSR